jgi:hypothetical protein
MWFIPRTEAYTCLPLVVANVVQSIFMTDGFMTVGMTQLLLRTTSDRTLDASR